MPKDKAIKLKDGVAIIDDLNENHYDGYGCGDDSGYLYGDGGQSGFGDGFGSGYSNDFSNEFNGDVWGDGYGDGYGDGNGKSDNDEK